jgi:hypothetical protein
VLGQHRRCMMLSNTTVVGSHRAVLSWLPAISGLASLEVDQWACAPTPIPNWRGRRDSKGNKLGQGQRFHDVMWKLREREQKQRGGALHVCVVPFPCHGHPFSSVQSSPGWAAAVLKTTDAQQAVLCIGHRVR